MFGVKVSAKLCSERKNSSRAISLVKYVCTSLIMVFTWKKKKKEME
jgi:hypothetical protein